jgi:hypothetical protein
MPQETAHKAVCASPEQGLLWAPLWLHGDARTALNRLARRRRSLRAPVPAVATPNWTPPTSGGVQNR